MLKARLPEPAGDIMVRVYASEVLPAEPVIPAVGAGFNIRPTVGFAPRCGDVYFLASVPAL